MSARFGRLAFAVAVVGAALGAFPKKALAHCRPEPAQSAPAHHHHLHPSLLHRIACDRKFIAGLETCVAVAPERGVKVHQHGHGCDFVGGDFITQRPRGLQRELLAL